MSSADIGKVLGNTVVCVLSPTVENEGSADGIEGNFIQNSSEFSPFPGKPKPKIDLAVSSLHQVVQFLYQMCQQIKN